MTTATRSRARTRLRALSTALIVSGTLLLADAGATLLWQEPVSAVYSRFQQGELQDQLATLDKLRPTPVEQRALKRLPDPTPAAGVLGPLARPPDRTRAIRSGGC